MPRRGIARHWTKGENGELIQVPGLEIKDGRQIFVKLTYEERMYIHKREDWTDPDGIRWCIDTLQELEDEALKDLAVIKPFTPNEWQYLAAVLKDRRPSPKLICSAGFLAECVIDAKNMVTATSLYEVNPYDIRDKIYGLSALHVVAVWNRIDNYWRFNMVDFSLWAQQ